MMKPLGFNDCQAMAKLHGQGFERGWSEDDFTAHVKNPLDIALGSFCIEALRGFIIVRIQQDQAEIITIVVGTAWQGTGLGKKILLAGEAYAKAKGAEIIFLDVAKDNVHALNLYNTANYQRCGTRPGYYRRAHGRVDAQLFQKHLTQKR